MLHNPIRKQSSFIRKSKNYLEPEDYNGYAPESSQKVTATASSDDCPTCGLPVNIPGYLRDETITSHIRGNSTLVPCPDCNAIKLTKQVKTVGQLQGELKIKTFDNFIVFDSNKVVYETILKWVEDPIRWVTLFGGYGPGKTHLAAAVTNYLGDKARYFNFPDITSQLRDNPDKAFDLIKNLEKVSVLVLDEFDKTSVKAWTREQIQRLFDHRYRNEKTHGLMICSNIAPNKLPDELQFVGSRMLTQGFVCLEMKGDARPIRNDLANLTNKKGD